MDRYLRMSFTVCTPGGDHKEDIDVSEVVAAGWVGRTPADLERHIEEMQQLGVSRPGTVPVFNRVANTRLTQRQAIEVLGPHSSGEVEFVLIQSKDHLYVGVGSDHSDSRIEMFCMAAAKQVYDKSIAPTLWRYDDVICHWDKLILRSYITVDNVRCLYQEGNVEVILHPETLINKYATDDGKLPEGAVLYGGTFSTNGGVRSGSRFEYELEDPVLNRIICHQYAVYELPFAC